MQRNNFLGHTGSDGSSSIQRLERGGIINMLGSSAHISGGHLTPEATFNSWMNSPEIRATILNPEFTHVGVGFIERPVESFADFPTYWTQQLIHLDADGKFDISSLEAAGVSRAEIQRMFEQEVIRIVNVIRREHGLRPLIYNSDLGRVARTLTDVIIEHNCPRGHICPIIGLEHTDYARHLGLNVNFAGENALRGTWTPQRAVDAWMASPDGHREFILSGLHGGGRLQQQWVNVNLRYIGVGFSWGKNHDNRTAWTLWQMPPMPPQ